jgi:hypothetical protein
MKIHPAHPAKTPKPKKKKEEEKKNLFHGESLKSWKLITHSTT